MANDTLIQSGRFTSDGEQKILQFRQDVDWFYCYNYTQGSTTQATGRGVEFYWQRGMSDDTAIEHRKEDSSEALAMVTKSSGGVTLINTSDNPVGAIDTTITAISSAAIPVVTVTSTAALRDNDIVRLIDVAGGQQLGGVDFTIGLVDGTSFVLLYMDPIAAATTGSFRIIKYDPLFYPRRRFIASISNAPQAVVSLTVAHGFTVGQQVRFIVPKQYGMREINNLSGTIVEATTDFNSGENTITVDIDTQAFSAFAFPLSAVAPFTHAQIVPIGEDAHADYANLLDDATTNSSYIGLKLAAGAQAPAGSDNDVIYWSAGKVDLVNNE